jgi:hypothetical protein
MADASSYACVVMQTIEPLSHKFRGKSHSSIYERKSAVHLEKLL